MGTIGGPRRFRNGMVLYLDANNMASYSGSGTVWTDISGYGNNGTLVSGVTFDSGTTKGMILDGSNDYIEFQSITPSFTYNYFTILLWVKPGVSQVQYADIFDNNHTGTQNFVLQQNVSNTNQYDFTCLNSVNFSKTPLFNLTANTWTYLCLIWNNDKASVYINGLFYGSGNSANPIRYNSPYLRIGKWAGGGRNWNGEVANFSVYNRALSDVEVLQNYNALKGRFNL